MSAIIQVTNISKQYRLGQVGTGTISHDLNRWWNRIRGKEDPFLKIGEENDRTKKGSSDYAWALRDINFEVQQGEVLGIIGRNGAGKSTLLKILSRTTAPTTGSIKIKGRVASLLEVGTGFHPELTGRENIYLNGAILGMTRHEIKSKFDEIVDFSGVERYIDTPVKRYSSGMYVRLAFAVAAHLEPEILIVDEVLAVGDADFQKKALGKMRDVSNKERRTVLFVSHSMAAISQLCTKSVLLQNGQIIKLDRTQIVVDHYLRETLLVEKEFVSIDTDKAINICHAYAQNSNKEKSTSFIHSQKIEIITTFLINRWIENSEFRLIVLDLRGKAIFTSDLLIPVTAELNKIIIMAEIPGNFLRPGSYFITMATFVPHKFHIHLLQNVLSLQIVDGGSKYAASEGLDYGYIFFEPKWSILPYRE